MYNFKPKIDFLQTIVQKTISHYNQQLQSISGLIKIHWFRLYTPNL